MKTLLILLILFSSPVYALREGQKTSMCEDASKIVMFYKAAKLHNKLETEILEKRMNKLKEAKEQGVAVIFKQIENKDYIYSEDDCSGREIISFYQKEVKRIKTFCSKAASTTTKQFNKLMMEALEMKTPGTDFKKAEDGHLKKTMLEEFKGAGCAEGERKNLIRQIKRRIKLDKDPFAICERTTFYMDKTQKKARYCKKK
jgi:hypothetical protein